MIKIHNVILYYWNIVKRTIEYNTIFLEKKSLDKIHNIKKTFKYLVLLLF